MKPIRLILENCHSYRGRHVIDFRGVDLAAVVGDNGSGKSTVIDAMRFNTFGRTRNGTDSIITEGEDACRVEFTFALGEQVYLISRQRSRKGSGSTLLSFQMLADDGPVVLDGRSVAETQRRIEETLHMTDDLFCVTACANQGNVAAFSNAKPAERKGVLSEILDLAAWEKRAEVTRQIGRDLTTQLGVTQEQLARAQAQAEMKAALEVELGQLQEQLQALEAIIEITTCELADLQEKRIGLTSAREADRACRSELEELAGRLAQLQATQAEAKTRQDTLLRAAKEKIALLEMLTKVEGAQTCSQEMEAKRQEDERLRHEAELLSQKQQAAIAQHTQHISELKSRIALATEVHGRHVRSLQQRITDLTAQAEPLTRVPCADTPLAADCPLIAAARTAKETLPSIQAELAAQQTSVPTIEDTRILAQLSAQTPAQVETARLREITGLRKDIGYDATEHARAKQLAGTQREIQERLGRVERAEAQLVEVSKALTALTQEIEQLRQRSTVLATELGPTRDWQRELETLERTITTTQRGITDSRSRLQAFQQRRGSIEERLRTAQTAAMEAETLSVTVREMERRLNLLKILVQAYGRSGIPALLIEGAVPDLEAVANDVLATLSDGRLSLALRSQRQTKAKTMQETLDIVIADESGERAYESFSGGEAMRVDLALRIALSTLLASRAGARCELLVLDEAAAPLDEMGRLLFIECLAKVAERFATVLCITHCDSLKDAFPARFEVAKNGHGSYITLVTN